MKFTIKKIEEKKKKGRIFAITCVDDMTCVVKIG